MNTQQIWHFEEVNLFDIFCPHKLKEYQDKKHFKQYQQGDFIYFEDDPAQKIYLVAEGKVKISFYAEDGKEIVKAILKKGEIFGELALFDPEKRSECAIAASENTVLCPLEAETMHELMRTYKTFSLKVYKLVGLRIKKLERKIEALITKDVKTRLIEFIYELALEQGQKVATETLIKHFLTHKDIADLIGTSRQTVTTLMNDLKAQNLINFDRKRILVRDLDKLKTALEVKSL